MPNRKDSFRSWVNQTFRFNDFGPRFERGDIKFVILDLLKDKPRHGYDIIHELEKKFQGFYSPSAGTIYPTLHSLEEQTLIKSDQKDDKKVYTITDQGLTFLNDHKDRLEELYERVQGNWRQHSKFFHETKDEIGQLVEFLFSRISEGELNAEKMQRLRRAFSSFKEEIEKILSEK